MINGTVYNRDFTSGNVARFFNEFSKLPWDQHIINMYGKKIPAPRKFVWMGIPPPKLYGHPVPTIPFTNEANELIDKLKLETGILYDSLNINMYRDQNDYLGWHIDPEDEGRWDYPIASISFGAERPFQMQPYQMDGRKRVRYGDITTQLLENGSLFIMPPGFQGLYEHRLAKSNAKKGMRINLTFRRMAP